MKNLGILIFTALLLSACQTSYVASSAYDDVYYTPKPAGVNNVAASQEKDNTGSGLNYGNNAAEERFQQTANPGVKYVDNQDNSSYKSSPAPDTLASPANESSDEYYYIEDNPDDYYDYDYASRIRRFNNSCGDCGYYSPVYTSIGFGPSYGFGMSMGYGWGMPYSGFSMNYGWGMGYPYYGWGMGYPYYYDPWSFDPWYSWYSYPYYGGSYWSGYNQGYWNGYYAGGGDYFSGGDYYPGKYYGPRNSRGGGQIREGGNDSRESRMGRIDDGQKNNSSYTMGRESRISGSGAMDGSKTTNTSVLPENGRTSRYVQPGENGNETIGNIGPGGVSGDIKSEKLTRPEDGTTFSAKREAQQEAVTGNSRNRSDVNIESQKISKPIVVTNEAGNSQRVSGSHENVSGVEKYSKPMVNGNENNVYSRTKRYAKPNSVEVQRNSQPKNYSSPTYNKPRSSNEYTVPSSRNNQIYTQPDNSNTGNSKVNTQPERSRNYYTPSKSNNSFSTPTRSNRNTVSPSRSGGGNSAPARSGGNYSSPARSGGGGNSAPARSGGNVSTSGGSSRSSGGSTNSSSGGGSGRRGR